MNVYLDNNLTSYGYQRAKIVINNGAVFAKTSGTHASVLLYIQEPQGLRGNIEQFAAVKRTVLEAFQRSGFTDTHCLTLVESWRVPELAVNQNALSPVWFIDESSQRLMIYEGGVMDFDGLRPVIERSLTMTQPRSAAGPQSAGRASQTPPYTGRPNMGQPYPGTPYPGPGTPTQPVQPARKYTNFKEFLAYQGMINVSIVAINVLIYLVLEVIGDTNSAVFMADHGALYAPWVLQGQNLYSLVTSMFLHFGFSHLFGNMLVLFFLGDNLERAVGHAKYAIVYFGAGLAGNLISMLIEVIRGDFAVGAGASGAIFGVVGALFVIVRRNKNKLEDLSTPKLGLFIAYTLYSGFTSSGVDNAAHVGGLLAGMLLAAILYRRKQA